MAAPLILTINTGSSSLKVAAYEAGQAPQRIFAATAKQIGHAESFVEIETKHAPQKQKQAIKADTPADALKQVLGVFEQQPGHRDLEMVGHRIVHGGLRFTHACRLDQAAIGRLEQLCELAPDHMPQALEAIRFFQQQHPQLAQMAAFDTTFHRHLPVVASHYGLPGSFAAEGIRRYGFHGLSYTYIVEELTRLQPDLAHGRLVVAHLGSGSSMAAIHHGQSVDTTMGFSPDGGLLMSSRAGDIDAAAVLHLIEQEGMTTTAVRALLNERAGLLGVSELSTDMQVLLGDIASDANAALAVEMFCYRARRTLGGYIAALGGIDALVFTGGIGENAAEVRRRICADMGFAGIELDDEANAAHQPVISRRDSRVQIRVMATDEDLIIAQEAFALMS